MFKTKAVAPYTIKFTDGEKWIEIRCSMAPASSPYGVIYKDATVIDTGPESDFAAFILNKCVTLRVAPDGEWDYIGIEGVAD